MEIRRNPFGMSGGATGLELLRSSGGAVSIGRIASGNLCAESETVLQRKCTSISRAGQSIDAPRSGFAGGPGDGTGEGLLLSFCVLVILILYRRLEAGAVSFKSLRGNDTAVGVAMHLRISEWRFVRFVSPFVQRSD